MRRTQKRIVDALLTAALVGGVFIFLVILVPYVMRQYALSRPDRYLVPPKPNEEVQARGHLKIVVANADLWKEKGRQVIGDLLERENVAPVASLIPYVGAYGFATVVPQRSARTPDIPDPPAELEYTEREDVEASRVAGGPVAAAIYGKRDWSFAPCILLIKYGARTSARTIRHQLIDRFCLSAARLVVCKGGKELLICVDGDLPEDDPTQEYRGKRFNAVYTAEHPNWEPRLLLGTEALGEWGGYMGQTVDAGSVYFLSDTVSGPYQDALLRVDTHRNEVHVISRDPLISGNYLIPSPDGAFLALGWLPWYGSGLTQRPIRLIDSADGSVHTLTWRDHGSYADCPLAWSADVPGRIYFVTVGGKLFQLDIDLTAPGPIRDAAAP